MLVDWLTDVWTCLLTGCALDFPAINTQYHSSTENIIIKKFVTQKIQAKY